MSKANQNKMYHQLHNTATPFHPAGSTHNHRCEYIHLGWLQRLDKVHLAQVYMYQQRNLGNLKQHHSLLRRCTYPQHKESFFPPNTNTQQYNEKIGSLPAHCFPSHLSIYQYHSLCNLKQKNSQLQSNTYQQHNQYSLLIHHSLLLRHTSQQHRTCTVKRPYRHCTYQQHNQYRHHRLKYCCLPSPCRQRKKRRCGPRMPPSGIACTAPLDK